MVIEIYAAMEDGVWLYDPTHHSLVRHIEDDIRAQTGLQDFVATAPLNLIYVAHGERMHELSAAERRLYASVDTGFIGQNVDPKAIANPGAGVLDGAHQDAPGPGLARPGRVIGTAGEIRRRTDNFTAPASCLMDSSPYWEQSQPG